MRKQKVRKSILFKFICYYLYLSLHLQFQRNMMDSKKKQINVLIRTLVGKIWTRFTSSLKKKGVRFSLLAALFLTIACYFANNFPLFTGETMLQYVISQQICDILGWHQETSYGDVVFFNTSYDIDTIPAIDYHNSEHPEVLGVNAITDRKKLSDFLDLLQKSNSYRYLIIDLLFDENDVSQFDDSLYNKIISIRDVVVANDDNVSIASKLRDNKNKIDANVSYYVTRANTSFSRYEYTENDERSIPMFVFEKMHPDKRMKRFGYKRFSLYFSNGSLCQNSNFLTFDYFLTDDVNNSSQSFDDENDITSLEYENLGVYLNKTASEKEKIDLLDSLTNSAIVIIGDFKNDIHDTYMGVKPGPLIMARAIQTLEEGKNIVSFWHSLLWLMVFFLISYYIYRDKPISNYIPLIKKIPYKFVHFIISLVTFSFALLLCSFIEYAFFDRVFSLAIPILFFTVLKLVIQYRKFDTL